MEKRWGSRRKGNGRPVIKLFLSPGGFRFKLFIYSLHSFTNACRFWGWMPEPPGAVSFYKVSCAGLHSPIALQHQFYAKNIFKIAL